MQLLVNITVLAAIYALLACGYVLIYRVSRVMNMAHGELAMLGAYLLFTTASLFVDHPRAVLDGDQIELEFQPAEIRRRKWYQFWK